MWSLDDPKPEDVHIEDIASGLSRICRYNGQLQEDYDFLSVAEHSVAMTVWAIARKVVTHREDALALLLHDGSEAFLGDMVSPVKVRDPIFKSIEEKTERAIELHFGTSPEMRTITKAQIKQIDRRICLDERDCAIADPARTLGKEGIWADDPGLRKLGVALPGLNPGDARKLFLEAFIHIIQTLPLHNASLADDHRCQLEKAQRMLERHIAREERRALMRGEIHAHTEDRCRDVDMSI